MNLSKVKTLVTIFLFIFLFVCMTEGTVKAYYGSGLGSSYGSMYGGGLYGSYGGSGGLMGGMYGGMATYGGTTFSSSTALTIRAKKSYVDDFAKGELDFEQFQEHVQIFMY